MLPFPKNPPVLLRARRKPYTFRPKDYGALGWWITSADSISVKPGLPTIETVQDLSGNGRHLATTWRNTHAAYLPNAWREWAGIVSNWACYQGATTPVTGNGARSYVVVAMMCSGGRLQYICAHGISDWYGMYGLRTGFGNELGIIGFGTDYSSSSTMTTTRPHVIASTYAALTHKLYLDGASIGSGPSAALNTPVGSPIQLNCRPGLVEPGQFLIFDAMLFTQELSAATIAAMSLELRAMYQF